MAFAIHFQHDDVSSMVLLGALGCVLAAAKIYTGGLMLQVVPHMQASVLAVVLNELR